MPDLETSTSRTQLSSILGWVRGRKWVQSDLRALKHRFLDFTQVAFWSGQEEENVFPVPGDHLKHALSTSPKSNFWLVKRQKMTFKCHSTTWIVAYSTWKNLHFRWIKKQKITYDNMHHPFFEFIQITIWAGKEKKMGSQCIATTRKGAFFT